MRKLAKLTLGLLALLFIYPTLALGYEKELNELAGSLTQKLLEGRKKKVAIVDFTDMEGNTTYAGRFLAEELSVLLSNLGSRTQFEVVDRMRLKSLLKEQGLEATGWVDPSMGAKLKKAAGINAIVAGNLTPFGDSLHLSVKILDAGSAKILFATSTDFAKTKIMGENTPEKKNPTAQNPPPRASVNPVPPPQPAPEPPAVEVRQKVETPEFVLELLECWASGPNLSCSMLLTNIKEYRNYKQSTAETRIIDPSGNEYRAQKLQLGTAEGWDSVQRPLVNGIATKAAASFGGVSPGVRTIALFEISCHLEGIGQYKAQFRSIPVTR
ncbi:MAG: CsgG/HfaB family protein [Limisphaerales bacterium]